MRAYLLEVGVLVDKDYEDGAYGGVYDKKYGYYDEGQIYYRTREKAINEADAYVNAGVDNTYGIVSFTEIPDDFDFDEGYVEDESYDPENVLYSIVKKDGNIITDFI